MRTGSAENASCADTQRSVPDSAVSGSRGPKIRNRELMKGTAMERILSKIARRMRRRSGRGGVAASVTVMLSVMPAMSNSVGFAQQQPGCHCSQRPVTTSCQRSLRL